MIRTINDFTERWQEESDNTLKIFQNLTDESLQQASPGGRSLGRLANHIIETLSELPAKLDLPIKEELCAYTTVEELVTAYKNASGRLIKTVTDNWTNANLEAERNMYGNTWKNGVSLWVLLVHQTHHRSQMTVLMRFAGLQVPGVYGPSKEEWLAWGEMPLA